jgi:hypothetical protein
MKTLKYIKTKREFLLQKRKGGGGGGAASMKRIKINFEICCRTRQENQKLYIVQWSNWIPTRMFFVLGRDLIRSSKFSKLK